MDSRSPSTPEPDSPVRVLPARHPWRSLASMLGVIVILVIVWALITNPRWQWGVVAQWFTVRHRSDEDARQGEHEQH